MRAQRNGRPSISDKLDNADSEVLCVNTVLGFREPNIALTGLAEEADI